MMMDDAAEVRAVYRRSGRVHWLTFLPGLVVTAATALVMASCLFWVYRKGFYLILAAPLIASFAVGGVWYLTLLGSHCRNRALATFASIALGLILYFGYYEVGLLHVVGVRNAHRIELWPRYVAFRMRTDVARDAHQPNPNPARFQGPDPVQRVFNWLVFGGELIAVVGILAAVGRTCTSKAYCEACGRWMKSETLKLQPGLAAAVWSAFRTGDYAAVREHLAGTSRQTAIGGVLTVEHCPACPTEQRSNAVYLTVKDVPIPGMPDPIGAKVGSLFKPRGSAGVRTLADHVELSAEEVGVLGSGFPGLHSTIRAHPALFAEAEVAARDFARAQGAPCDRRTDELAHVEAVEPQDAGMVLNRTNAVLQTVIGIGSSLGGIALALGPAGVLLNLEPKPPDWVLGVATVWLLLCLLLNLVWCLFFVRYPTARFMLGQTRRAFEHRPNPAVDLNDPELVFVDIIPRINWGKAMMENASDIGFLQLDRARRELIFEGDRERYWIPVESILEVKHEFWAESVQHELQRAPSLNHLVVVRAMTADGPWETWFYQRQNRFRMHTAKRRLADALELQEKIRELMTS